MSTRIPPTTRLLLALPGLLLMVLLTGCDETAVLPFAEHDYEVSVYGALDNTAPRHELRVVPIRLKLDRPTEPPAFDAVVTTTEVTSGRVDTWEAVGTFQPNGAYGLRFPDGSYGTVLTSTFPVHPGETYRLEIRQRDGAVTTATTTVPRQPAATLEAPVIAGSSVTQAVRWSRLSRPPARAEAYYVAGTPLRPEAPKQAFFFEQESAGTGTTDDWRVEVDLARDVARIRRAFAEQYDLEPAFERNPDLIPIFIDDNLVKLWISVLDDAWQLAADEADLARLAQPGAASNVENGLGFFGARGRFFYDWELTGEVRTALGL